MRFRPILANVLPDLKLAQLGDQPRSQRQTQKERRYRGKGGAKRGVPEHAERREAVKQLFVEQPIEHLVVVARDKPFQGVLDVRASRTLEQNHVAWTRDPPQVFSGRAGVGEQKSG